jgi:hypothetical protein
MSFVGGKLKLKGGDPLKSGGGVKKKKKKKADKEAEGQLALKEGAEGSEQAAKVRPAAGSAGLGAVALGTLSRAAGSSRRALAGSRRGQRCSPCLPADAGPTAWVGMTVGGAPPANGCSWRLGTAFFKLRCWWVPAPAGA